MSTGSDTGSTKGDVVPELEEITSYQWRSQTIPSGISPNRKGSGLGKALIASGSYQENREMFR